MGWMGRTRLEKEVGREKRGRRGATFTCLSFRIKCKWNRTNRPKKIYRSSYTIENIQECVFCTSLNLARRIHWTGLTPQLIESWPSLQGGDVCCTCSRSTGTCDWNHSNIDIFLAIRKMELPGILTNRSQSRVVILSANSSQRQCLMGSLWITHFEQSNMWSCSNTYKKGSSNFAVITCSKVLE